MPVILVLADGFLTMTGRDGQVFSTHASAVSVGIGRMGTMSLTCTGTTYAIVGRGGDISPKFTADQVTHLANLGAPPPISAAGPHQRGSMSAMLGNTHEWPEMLRAAGATVA